MSAARDYNRFLANSGAGVDAAGRLVFSGPSMMYAGPGEFARAQQTLREAEMRMMEEENPAETRRRQMMDRLAQYAPPTGYNFDFRMLDTPSNVSNTIGGR